jgi:micrococcal nuclease
MPLASTLLLCTVLFVQDGDSLRARCDGHAEPLSVRLHAIDAPEHGQPYGRRAAQALAALVARRPVALHCVDTDRYGRQVCQVKVAPAEAPGGAPDIDAGLALVQGGLAWWYAHFSAAQTPGERAQYAAAQQQARERRMGLWRDGERAEPPWEWRRAHPREPVN